MSEIVLKTKLDFETDVKKASNELSQLKKDLTPLKKAYADAKAGVATYRAELKKSNYGTTQRLEIEKSLESELKVRKNAASAVSRQNKKIEEQERKVLSSKQALKEYNTEQKKIAKEAERQVSIGAAKAVGDVTGKREELKAQIESYKQLASEFGSSSEQAKGAAKQISVLKAELDTLQEEAKATKTQWQKFTGALVRTSRYMIARRSMLGLIKATRDGMRHFAAANVEMDAAMSNIMNQMDRLKAQIGVAFGSLIIAIEPVIAKIIELVGMLADGISALVAALSGKDSFMRAKKEVRSYADEVSKAKNLLMGFDKLNILGQEDRAPTYEEVSIGEMFGDVNVLGGIVSIVTSLLEVVKPLFDLIKTFSEAVLPSLLNILNLLIEPMKQVADALSEILQNVIKVIDKFIKWGDETGVLRAIIYGLATILSVKFASALLKASIALVVFMAKSAKTIALSIASGIAFVFKWVASNPITALAAAGVAAAAGASIWRAVNSSKSKGNTPAMATGGVVSAPTMALVGEGRYPEAVVPLGSSPQFRAMKDDIARAVSNNRSYSGAQEINLTSRLEIGGRLLDEYIERVVANSVQSQIGRNMREFSRGV